MTDTATKGVQVIAALPGKAARVAAMDDLRGRLHRHPHALREIEAMVVEIFERKRLDRQAETR